MNYETLKAAVANVIKTNGNEEITGQLLQDVLMAIINALGSGYQFMGIATAETTPGTPDQRVFYLAGSAGSTVLPGFGITVDHEICVLMYSDEWEKQTLLQFDSVLTSGSQNLVTSGMVYDAVTNLSQAINGLAEIVGGHTTAIESLQETVGGHTTAINNLQYAVVAIQAAIESLQADVAQKIDKSDADSLVVGSAQGILATSAVEAFFLFQQSGATGDGAALIPTIKGKTIAWNQLRETPSYTNTQVDTRPFFDLRIMGCDSPTISLNPVYYVTEEVTTKGRRVYVFTASRPYLIIKHNGAIQDLYMLTNMPTISGHKYFLSFDVTGIDPTTAGGLALDNAMLTDLTILGLGDLTAVQFETFYNKLYYSPVPGVLKNNDAVAMITNGRNQWDEVWEQGSIASTGENMSGDGIRSKNYSPAFPNTTYFINDPGAIYVVYFYDANKGLIPYTGAGAYANGYNGGATPFTTPAGTAYFRIRTASQYGNTYKNDICVNLSNPAKNGTYEPYWTRKVNLGLDAIKVKSPNIWDEEYTSGNGNNGDIDYAQHFHLVSTNFIPVFPGQTYYFKSVTDFLTIYGYDSNKQKVANASLTSVQNATYTIPAGVYYIKFQRGGSNLAYNNDICINLSAPGINGKYFSYGEDGILTYNGLDGAGTAFDFIFKDANGVQKLQKTMTTEIDLGELTGWTFASIGSYNRFTKGSVGIKPSGGGNTKGNLICNKYVNETPNVAYVGETDKVIAIDSDAPTIYLVDSSITAADIVDGKIAKLAGVKIIGQSNATPAILELAEPIPDMFLTAQGGTMLIVSPEGATAPSAPFSADIVYPVDPIASSGASLKNLLEALKTATVITSYTMTFNSTTQQYEFTITK